jgi:hypothetical protein
VKILNMSLVIGGVTALIAATAPMPSPAHAQDTEAAGHRDWTLQQREDWLTDRVVSSRDNGALDHSEYNRARDAVSDIRHEEDGMRDRQGGQLTPNQTADLEARLDEVARRIHWANEANATLPW